ncbi:MAG: TrbI/VirB10 family protein [Synergistaceae bacterium]|nr:TrbI/VirB10 family protein [Synergistaceae bacterium]MBR0081099.1 TrbI/VirB10 family protein [Synergistaceae bacterium]MBR0234267.1 TrbI/VirB10 family protein [Synergistaceae bacterium]
MSSDSPDRFEPSAQQKVKQGKSASKRIALFVFIGAGIIFTLVAMSILTSENGLNGSNAPVNLFEASRGAQSIAPPRPKPPEPEPVKIPEPAPAPQPQRVRPAYIPVPKVSDIRKQNQVQRLLAANSPTTIQAFREQTHNSGNSQNGNNSDTIAEVSRLLSNAPVNTAQSINGMPFMPTQNSSLQSDPNGWNRKDNFTKQAVPEEYSKHSVNSPQSILELKSGTILSCVLISGLNSDLPGNMIAQVSENVWDTATGRYLLIPRGSRLIGTYDNQISYGQSRVLVMWSRLIFPDGSSLVLDNLKGADQSGYSGFKGQINRHWGSIISSALLVSLLGAGVEIAAPTDNNRRDTDDPRSILAENAATAVAEAMTQIIKKESDRQPTIKIKPGYRFMIFVQHDIIFPRVWRN